MSDDDLIDPSSIVVPEVDASALEAAAADIRKQGGRIAGSGQDIKSAWSELDSCYSAPEAETLLSAMDPVVAKGDDVESDLDEAATALETFAETARDLKAKIDVAKQDAQNFVDSVKGDDSWDDASGLFGETSDKVEEHNALLDRVATLVHRYQEAERECANKITSLFDGGPTFVGADPQGGTEPGKGEKLYGTEEPLTGGPNPWGKPQGSDFPWWVDWGVGEYGTKLGMLQDAGAQTGFYTEDGWGVDSMSEWAGNVWTDWADSVAGTGAMIGAWNPETGTWTQDGRKLDVAQTAWKNAAHEFFPWTELEERPGYVFGTAGTNVGFTVAGIALSATGVGAVVGAPLAASRVAKALGGAGRGEGHFSVDGGTNADSDGGGSGQDGGGSRRPGAGPDGNSGDKEGPPSGIDPGEGFDLSGIGDMNESLDNLADAQRPSTPRWTPQPEPDPAPDAGPAPDASPRPDAPEAGQAPPESGRPAEADTPDRQNAPEHPGGVDEPVQHDPSRRDPTTEEVDESFAEIARRNEGLGDAMDDADGGRMAELDGEDPWTIEALEDAEGDTGRGGPGGPDDGDRVPVAPDGMELSHMPGEGDPTPDGSPAPETDTDAGRVEVTDDRPPEGGQTSGGDGGGAPGGGRGGGSLGPDEPVGESAESGDWQQPMESRDPGNPEALPESDEEASPAADGPMYSDREVPVGLTPELAQEMGDMIAEGLEQRNLDGEVVVQGSRVTGVRPNGEPIDTADIDIGIRVDQDTFSNVISERFKSPNPGSSKEARMLHAIDTGKIQSGEAGLRPLRKQLEDKLGMKVDISVIQKSGQFDRPPFIKVDGNA
ncbi:hypothetical protein LP52_01420 [Streptomonospora alba]|uniref:Polymerase nucleotidyl transferase domain-containing protein n=1 Tax=Streptomonospora alba TaxID=183763 RepID=A0A0C2JNI5_9ACTN|nr:hypothetical protein [Streptomonospora alba]KII00506.1 hypothetical protein LP52_01420 [Streptomonospora alba]